MDTPPPIPTPTPLTFTVDLNIFRALKFLTSKSDLALKPTHGILIQGIQGKLIAGATNGVQLGIFVIEGNGGIKIPDFKIAISADTISQIRFKPSKRTGPWTTMIVDLAANLTGTASFRTGSGNVTEHGLEGTYPDLIHILPTGPIIPVHWGFDLDLLNLFGSVAKAMGQKPQMQLYAHDNDKVMGPFSVRMNMRNFYGAIMPVKGYSFEPAPFTTTTNKPKPNESIKEPIIKEHPEQSPEVFPGR